jgi:glucose-1-phosphate cytidylyltransferase
MTGGRLAAVRKYVEGDEPFLLTYGDGVSDVDIGRSIAFHAAHGKAATVTAVRPMGRFGELAIEDGRVTQFNEKPQATEGFINGGFFVLDGRKVWPFVGEERRTIFEQEPLRRLSAAGELVAFQHTGFWQPMDTAREYSLLNDLWSSGKAQWKTW